MNGGERLERLLTRIVVPLKRWAASDPVRLRRAEVQEIVRLAEEARQEAVALRGTAERTHIPEVVRARVLARAKNRCVLCTHEFTPDDPAEIDHIIPLARFGTTTEDNLQAIHASCNRQKGAA